MPATIYDIAKVANTSYGTVSRALSGKSRISDKTRKKVLDAAKNLGYRPMYAARTLKMGKTFTAGLILPDFINPFYVEFLRAAEEECITHKYQLMATDYALTAERQRLSLERMLENRCDGIIAFLTRFEPVEDLLNEFWTKRIPCIMPGLRMGESNSKIDGVIIDLAKSVEAAVDHLVELGHRDISLLLSLPSECVSGLTGRYNKSKKNYVSSKEDDSRIVGLAQAFKKHKLDFESYSVLNKFDQDQIQIGKDLASELLAANPATTAIIAGNDLLATGVLNFLSEVDMCVPRDISIISTDNTWLAQRRPVPLTSIDIKTSELAHAAVKILFERLENSEWQDARRVAVDSELIIRQSTGPARKQS